VAEGHRSSRKQDRFVIMSYQVYEWQLVHAYSYGVPDNESRVAVAAPPSQPYLRVPWVAAGFEAMREVHLLQAETTWMGTVPPALTLLAAVVNPVVAGFGASVLVRDFDEDGHLDLAVGAPGPLDRSAEGSVWVYFGCGSACTGPSPLDLSSPLVLFHTTSQPGDQFG